jgi:hypothetical protein
LRHLEYQFIDFAHREFFFQRANWTLNGKNISDMASELNNIYDSDTAFEAALSETRYNPNCYNDMLLNLTTGKTVGPQTAEHLAKIDPAFILGQFLWHCGPTSMPSNSTYRIYVTPQVLYCPRVFYRLVEQIYVPRPPGIKFPNGLKLMIPGPIGFQRADKIVMYCANKEEMIGGVNFLREYQKVHSSLFENVNPRSTKPVEGLNGVSVTPQPTPDETMMAYAGQHETKGMSFGQSRAAIIYLAMLDNYGKNNIQKFLVDCYRIAQIANIDIRLERDDLNI